jgi:hypothetical protein
MKYFFKLSIGILFFAFITTNAQNAMDSSSKSFANSLRFGGGVGLSFGNNFFSGSLSPFVLHEVNEFLQTGVGLNVSYSKFDNSESFIYGGSVMAFANPLPEIQLSAEFEQLNVNRSLDTINGTIEQNYWYPALFLGAGYVNGNVTFGVRYDVLYDGNKSIYGEAFMPFVRFMF